MACKEIHHVPATIWHPLRSLPESMLSLAFRYERHILRDRNLLYEYMWFGNAIILMMYGTSKEAEAKTQQYLEHFKRSHYYY